VILIDLKDSWFERIYRGRMMYMTLSHSNHAF